MGRARARARVPYLAWASLVDERHREIKIPTPRRRRLGRPLTNVCRRIAKGRAR